MSVKKNIAIIGAGPASSTLAVRLCEAGYHVAIFATFESVPILVGESLVPMIIPMLQTLGVEQEVAAYSIYKPGACFTYNADEIFQFRFSNTPTDLPSYSYNVPRDKFNATLLNAAERAGAILIKRKVKLSANSVGKIILDNDSIKAATHCWNNQAPNLIIDAAGRANIIGRLLDIPMKKGTRQDVALFAHVDQTELVDPGYVHNDRIEQGWCWRIPLPNRVSLGFVIPESYASQYGDTAEQQYDALLRNDKVLQKIAPKTKRLTPVLRFNNYQSISDKLSGENWVMLGDSGGFVDPIFSSGMLIAMDSAFKLAETIINDTPLSEYESVIKQHLEAWFEIASYYYDGRLMTSIKVGETLPNNIFNRWLFNWIEARISRIFSGAAASQPFSFGLLRILVRHGLKNRNPDVYKIK
ncbi:MAG: NAD(P)/FAD-dependent oxidoreductase [Methylococcales symbiont of Hymedesmia sp. n. MRB-2018]|nr:MAG: NAD(P)/FAD-dependent oxidoreductase [Methylococcales symbiont of Hymedesmia sp. n. MRB-2018]